MFLAFCITLFGKLKQIYSHRVIYVFAVNSSNMANSNATFDTVLEVSINSLMSQIRNYTEDQLQALLNDEDRLNSMVDSMPQVNFWVFCILVA